MGKIPVHPPARAFAAAALLTAALLSSLAAPTARATSVQHFGTAQLTELSDTIVRGTVVKVEARLHPEHQFIYTYVTVRVDEPLKGLATSGQEIVLQELGGRVDRTIHHVPGVPDYREGEQVVSFLENHVGGFYRTYGMIQGKFSVASDPRNGREILTRPAEWNDVALAQLGSVTDLSPMRPDASYDSAEMLSAIREWTGR